MANSLLTCDKPSLSTRAGSPGRCPRTRLSLPRDHLESPHLLPVRSRRRRPPDAPNPSTLPGRCLRSSPGRGSRPGGARRAPSVPRTCRPSPAARAGGSGQDLGGAAGTGSGTWMRRFTEAARQRPGLGAPRPALSPSRTRRAPCGRRELAPGALLPLDLRTMFSRNVF